MTTVRWRGALVLIGLLAVMLRIAGLSWGLPYELHPDETLILSLTGAMSWSDLNPGFFIYPGFFLYQVFGLGRLVVAVGGESAAALYAARLLTAAYSLATVGLVYLLGARFGGRRLGAIAASFTAVTGALTLHAHYAVTDTPVTALATGVVWLAVRGWQRRSFGEIGGAAALAGLAVSTKYSVAPVCVVPWLGAMALAARDRASIAHRLSRTALLAAISIAAFLLTSPFTLIDYRGFLDDMAVESELQAGGRAGYHVEGLATPAWRDRAVVTNAIAAYDDLGPGALALALGTIFSVLVRVRRDSFDRFLAVAWVLPYFAFMAPSAIGGQRYMLPIYPVMMLLAAAGVDALMRAAARGGSQAAVAKKAERNGETERSERKEPRWVYVGGIALFLIAAVPPLIDAASSARLLAQRDTRLLARDWIVANLEQRSHLAREFYAPPIHTSDNFRLSQPFSLTEHPLETYCAEEVDFLILSSLNADRYLEPRTNRFATERAWYDRLDTRTRVIHRIDGLGALELHHPTIEIRQLFCPQDQ